MTEPKTNIVRDRQQTHGDPVENMTDIAYAWTGVLGHPVTAEDVGRCMSALHLVRDRAATVADPSHLEHADGYTDITRLVKGSRELCNCDTPNKACPCPTHEAPLIVEGNTAGSREWLGDDVHILRTILNGPILLEDGTTYNPFVMNRVAVILSVPRGSHMVLRDPMTTMAHQLLEGVAKAVKRYK